MKMFYYKVTIGDTVTNFDAQSTIQTSLALSYAHHPDGTAHIVKDKIVQGGVFSDKSFEIVGGTVIGSIETVHVAVATEPTIL